MRKTNVKEKVIAAGAATVGTEAVAYILYEGGAGFGIAAAKLRTDGSVAESAHFGDVTADRTDAERIFRLVKRGKVTPCVLGEVLEELICE